MAKLFFIFNDVGVVFFELRMFTKLMDLRKDTVYWRTVMHLGCIIIMACYYTAAYWYGWNPSTAPFLFVSLPALLLFYCLNRYRDGRFFLTFFMVDAIFILAGSALRCLGSLLTNWEVSFINILNFAVFLFVLYKGKDRLLVYHERMQLADVGWSEMAKASALIYLALLFSVFYLEPEPGRLENMPIYLVFALVFVSCYLLLLQLAEKMRQIYEQNSRLEYEKEIYRIAYTDALTGLSNRAAYVEAMNVAERNRKELGNICCVIMDLNYLKIINDSYGHYMGDIVLKAVAEAGASAFGGNESQVFRIGGDEFAALLLRTSRKDVERRITDLECCVSRKRDEIGLDFSVAVGYVFLEPESENTLEEAFIMADERMYQYKKIQKRINSVSYSLTNLEKLPIMSITKIES